MSHSESIEAFLGGDSFAVVGASQNRSKYGNKVLRCYQQHQRTVYPVNPAADQIEGLKAYPKLTEIPEAVHGVSVVAPPAIAHHLVREAAELGIRHLWFQPGAESDEAISLAQELALNIIANGPCLLVVLGFTEQA